MEDQNSQRAVQRTPERNDSSTRTTDYSYQKNARPNVGVRFPSRSSPQR